MKKLCAFGLALVSILSFNSAVAAPLLALDVDDRTVVDVGNTLAGFQSFVMPGSTASSTVGFTNTFGSYNVALAPFDDGQDENLTTAGVQNTIGAIDDRDRALPTDAESFTYSQIYDDMIFAGNSTGFGGGMDLKIWGGELAPNTSYVISLYAYDSESKLDPQPRTANWLDKDGNVVLTTAFRGSTPPDSNDTYKFTATVTTDASGFLLLYGRNAQGRTGTIQPSVFLNGLELSEVPEPSSLSLMLVGAGALMLRRRKA